MSFRKDVDEMMKNVQVDYEMTNNIMNNTVRNSGKKYRGFRKKAIVVVTLATLCIGTMAVGVSGFSGAWNNIVQLIQHKGIEIVCIKDTVIPLFVAVTLSASATSM